MFAQRAVIVLIANSLHHHRYGHEKYQFVSESYTNPSLTVANAEV